MTSELRIKIAESLGYWRDNYSGMWRNDNIAMERLQYTLPEWPTDANAALQLVEVLKGEGWSVQLMCGGQHEQWACSAIKGKEWIFERCATFPEAICLAYCAVKSIK